MGWYKMVASPRSDVIVEDLLLRRKDDGNEVVLSTQRASELSEEDYATALTLANRVNYRIIEVDAPNSEQAAGGQPVGADVSGISPLVGSDRPQSPTPPAQGDSPEASTAGAGASSAPSTGANIGRGTNLPGSETTTTP